MDAFVSRKRSRSSSEEPKRLVDNAPPGSQDETDFKLALLSSLAPEVEHTVLLEALLAHDGNVDTAAAALADDASLSSPRKKSRMNAATGYQASLSSFNITATDANGQARALKPLTKKGRTLHLYSPEDIEQHCPCSLIHNFLPADLANALTEELVDESPTYYTDTFKLFDRVVTSPHTFCFYVHDLEEAERQKSEYTYNGALVEDVRASLPFMKQASVLVEDAVNREIARRVKDFYPDGKKLQYMSRDNWQPNTAFVNCYDGGAQNVGYHSDQLTYLGPRAIIGSLSLGVSREFRVRKISVKDEEVVKGSTADETRADSEGQIAIHLPHNSLLVMHAEMQEEWKHSIAPALSITPHPLAANKRLNITYRFYRDYLHPKFTPKCKCDIPCALRCVQRKKGTRGRYCWMCHANYSPGKDGCGWFEWAVFDGDGRPDWADGFLGEGVQSAERPELTTQS